MCYFYTDTIHEFRHLLTNDELKMVCINSWKYLVDHNLVKIYAYVIMPNHIHLLWKMLSLNGKESPAGSFAKFTAHQLNGCYRLAEYKDDLGVVETSNCTNKRTGIHPTLELNGIWVATSAKALKRFNQVRYLQKFPAAWCPTKTAIKLQT